MRVMTASEVKNKPGSMSSLTDNDSLLITKNGGPALLAFTPDTGKKLVLASYSHGSTTRCDAMQFLGIEWYGDLLDALASTGFERPSVSDEARSEMAARAFRFLQNSLIDVPDTPLQQTNCD